MDATETALVRKTFESALAEGGADAAALLENLGWWELYAAEPRVATAELFEAQGRLGRATSALDVVVAQAFGQTLTGATAVLHPAPGMEDGPPGRAAGNGAVHFDGLVVAGLERASRLIVPYGDDGRLGLAEVELAGLDVRQVGGLDPGLRLVAVRGIAAPSGCAPAGEWAAVALAARRALAHELCGLTQAVLDRAVAHVTDRHQFGRPIAAFQTVRHRLTEVYVALASARSALDASWASGEPLLADAAKALAGWAGLLAARHCLQVTGAIGFTEEYQLAGRIRRVHLLDALYGSADALQAAIGARLLADRSLPRLHPFP
ncbi:MAG TPA: acyl-CoA dehydrogenase family protein [Acidimicrobiia bacterium]|nr:acyl-CoA dehydrogenase family protein [Acidimicrobiia bacterium]